jgi:hypothetical protein
VNVVGQSNTRIISGERKWPEASISQGYRRQERPVGEFFAIDPASEQS